MGRSASSIQAEIDRLEAFLSGAGTTIQGTSADGTSTTLINRAQAEKRLDTLYTQLDRATGNARMFARGVLTGLRRR
jgi:hypothetical protein